MELQKVVVGILEKDNLFLGVSRRNNHNSIGLVGGKADNQEDTIDALIRETIEETGLIIIKATLLDVREYAGYETYCYIINEYQGELTPNEKLIEIGEGICGFFDKSILCGDFCGDYNELILQKYFEQKVK